MKHEAEQERLNAAADGSIFGDAPDPGDFDGDKVRAIFSHFDANKDGRLTYPELRSLQLETSGALLDGPTYCALCAGAGCPPGLGLTLEALRDMYAGGEGADADTDLDEDYETVMWSQRRLSKLRQQRGPDKGQEDGSGAFEVGDGGNDGDEFLSVFRELVAGSEGPARQTPAEDSAEQPSPHPAAASTAAASSPVLAADFVAGPSAEVTDLRLRALHRHFDADGDGRLTYGELRAFQLATKGTELDGSEYCLLAREYGCEPKGGLHLNGLRAMYALDESADADADFAAVFDEDVDPKDVVRRFTEKGKAVRSTDQKEGDSLLPISLVGMACKLTSPTSLMPTSSLLSSIPSPAKLLTATDALLWGYGGTGPYPLPSLVDGDSSGGGEGAVNGDSAAGSAADLAAHGGSASSAMPADHVDDQVRALHSCFDVDCDGRLDYAEFRNLQLRTSGEDIDAEEYLAMSTELDCDAGSGLTVEALQRMYSSGSGSIRGDFETVFRDGMSSALALPVPMLADWQNGGGGTAAVGRGGVDNPHSRAERIEKVRLLFDHFDADGNGLLSYPELRRLQLETSGEDMDGPQFTTVCEIYGCDPKRGLALEQLQAIYSAPEGPSVEAEKSKDLESNLHSDYVKVFRKYIYGQDGI